MNTADGGAGRVSLAPATVLGLGFTEIVELAERTGFDYIGVRLVPASPRGDSIPLHADRSALNQAVRLVEDSHISVWEIESVHLDEQFAIDQILPVLEAAARLGARSIHIVGDDKDASRLAASYAAVAAAATQFNLTADLGYMPWGGVRDLNAAAAVVAQADGAARGVLVDAFHWHPSSDIQQLSRIPTAWLHYARICDAAKPRPRGTPAMMREATTHRLSPGRGCVELDELWARLPPNLPVSLDAPNHRRVIDVGIDAWVREALADTKAFSSRVPSSSNPARDRE